MNRRVIGIVAALLLASVGALTLIGWAAAAEQRALAGERTVEVLVVREAITKGMPAEELAGLVEVEQVPAKVQAMGSVADLDDLSGKVTNADLVPGEQLVVARFAEPEVLAQQDDVQVPEGMQEVTISLEPQRAVGGKLRAGDTAGLVASFDSAASSEDEEEGAAAEESSTTHFILHKVLVTRVQAAPVAAPQQEGEETDDAAPDPLPAGSLLITLAVEAGSVERIVFAQEFGRLWLTAEPGTATEDGTSVQTRATIYE